MRPTSVIVEPHDKFAIWEIGRDRAREVTEFVFAVYLQRFSQMYGWQGEEYEKMRRDDLLHLENAKIFAAVSHAGDLFATARITKRAEHPLPIEADFGIDAMQVCRRRGIHPRSVYEAGRFAKSGSTARRAGLGRTEASFAVDGVVRQALQWSTRTSGSVWFGSVDAHVLRLLQHKGLPFERIGRSRTYIGSPTVPTFLSLDKAAIHMRNVHPREYAAYFGTVPHATPAA